MPDQSTRRDQGFTLIELMIAITVSGLILSALSLGFITTIRGTKDLHDRFVQSHDAQLLAAYFPADVQSADPTLPLSTSASAWAPCTGTSPASEPNILHMQWTETNGAATTAFAVSYRTRQVPVVPNENVRYQLVRYFCYGSAVKSDVVAHNIASPAPPTINGQTVSLTLTSVPGPVTSTAGDYSFTFSGRMRTPVPPPPYPRVSSITRKTATPTNASSVSWKVLFDRPVTGVNGGPVGSGPTDGDFDTIVTGLSSVGAPTVTAVSATEYTVAVTNTGSQGAVALKLVDNDTITDMPITGSPVPLGGVGNGNGDYTGQTYGIDRASPTVSSVVIAGASPTSGPNVSWTVMFSEPVTGVAATNFTPVASGVSSAGITVTPVSDSIYTVTVGSVSGSGTLRLDVSDGNTIKDNAANPLGGTGATDGNFSDPATATYTINGAAPAAPSITDVQLVNNGTAGKMETGDQVVITFSAVIKVSSFCSAWSGDGSNQSLTAGNDVTVTVTNDGVNDKVTLSSGSCTFKFGTLELLSDYVSGNVTFAGNGSGPNTPSNVAWDATNHKLTITLGKESHNNRLNTGVLSSLPKYTVDGAVTDPAPYNQPVSPDNKTATTSQRF